MMNRYMITGGAGVIGREMVAKLLARGCVVWVGDLKQKPLAFSTNVQYRQADLNSLTKAEVNAFKPDVIIHLAATFERSVESSEFWGENFRHNVQLSHHVMTLAQQSLTLKRVVFASSYLIYDPRLYQHDTPEAQPTSLSEVDPILPRNLTGMAKLSHEIELRFLADQPATQFSIACARIFRGYGLNSRDVISRWVRSALNGESIEVYNPEGIFDYIYAKDTAEGLIRLAEADGVTGIINLGTGKSRQVADIVSILKKHFPSLNITYHKNSPPIEASQADTSLWQKKINWLPEVSLEGAIEQIISFEKDRKSLEVTEQQRNTGILVTSSAAKVPLIRSVLAAAHKLNDCATVWAGDCEPDVITRYIADDFILMPRLNDNSLSDITAACIERHISTIIPTRDGELEFWATHQSRLKESGIQVIVSPLDSVSRCLDKLEFAQFGLAKNLPFIPASKSLASLPGQGCEHEGEHPVYCVKERFGAGSKSIGLNLTQVAAVEHATSLDSPIFQPYIEGREISVDAWLDQQGQPKGIIMRYRDKVVNGESQITTTFRQTDWESTLFNILSTLNLRGPVVLQAIIDSSDNLHIIECNSRFGGASTASIAAGLDSFYWSLLESQGRSLINIPFVRIDGEVKQVRVPHDELIHDIDI